MAGKTRARPFLREKDKDGTPKQRPQPNRDRDLGRGYSGSAFDVADRLNVRIR